MHNYLLIPIPILAQFYQSQSLLNQKTQIIGNNHKQPENIRKKYSNLKKKFGQLEKENTSLRIEIKDLQAKLPQSRKKKIKRRAQDQLIKDFKCPFERCLKEYASQLALNLHMKMKHNAGTKRQRIQLVSHIIQATQKGYQLPELCINLPPNYLQEFQRNQQAKNLKQRI